MWEDLKVPIVPVMFFGAYDLWPTGSWLNNHGTVVIKYLKPIMPNEANDRDEMHYLVSLHSIVLLILIFLLVKNENVRSNNK